MPLSFIKRTLIKGTLTVDDGQDLISNTRLRYRPNGIELCSTLSEERPNSARAYCTYLSGRLMGGCLFSVLSPILALFHNFLIDGSGYNANADGIP